MKKKRYLIKLSGEVLKSPTDQKVFWDTIDHFCKRLIAISNSGVELGIVVGGGNIFRGASGDIDNYNRVLGDQVGMMATVINGLALIERLKANGIEALLQSGIKIEGVADLFDRDKVESVFSRNGIVVFCGGIGNPYFSTDTTSVLRALQINADCIFKATKVNGIYDKDPMRFTDAKKYDTITFDEIIKKELKVMDLAAILLMKENNMNLMVFHLEEDSLLEKACAGERIGTFASV